MIDFAPWGSLLSVPAAVEFVAWEHPDGKKQIKLTILAIFQHAVQ